MPVERERKFLVVAQSWLPLTSSSMQIAQGYLAISDTAEVRIRRVGDVGRLTIKSAGAAESRLEFEYDVPSEHVPHLFGLCGARTLTKIRHLVLHDGRRWEVDVYTGRHEGLVVAEVELDEWERLSDLPPWLGRELTGEQQYGNAALALSGLPLEPGSDRA